MTAETASALTEQIPEQRIARPVLVLTDETMLAEVRRCAAAAGCPTERAPDLAAISGDWLSAPLIVLDEHALRDAEPLPRRGRVLLVSKGPPPQSVWRNAFAAGIRQVIVLPEDEPALVSAFADIAEGPRQSGGRVIAVVGGRGGAGASVLATAVGHIAPPLGADSLLVDCDPLGGGLDLLLGAECDVGMRWPEVRINSGRVAMSVLDDALLHKPLGDGRLTFLSCDRTGAGPKKDAVAAVLDAGRRAGRIVVCDVPRQIGAVGAVAAGRADLIALVVPADVRACASARQVLTRLGKPQAPVRLVVGLPSPEGLTPGDVADAVGAEVLVAMTPDKNLTKSLRRGGFDLRSKGPLVRAARAVLDAAQPAVDEDGILR